MATGNERTGTLHDALQGLDFPVTPADVVRHAEARGVETLAWGNKKMTLRVVFAPLEGRTFLTEADVAAAVAAVEEATSG